MPLSELILETQKLTLPQKLHLIAILLKSISQTLFRLPHSSQPPQSQTILERMGGPPQYLLEHGNLSDRAHRRAAIQAYLQDKQCQRLS